MLTYDYPLTKIEILDIIKCVKIAQMNYSKLIYCEPNKSSVYRLYIIYDHVTTTADVSSEVRKPLISLYHMIDYF